MHRPARRVLLLAATTLALASLATACSSDEPGGTIPDQYDLEGQPFTVGSKNFTEQLILGKIAVQALEAAGADVTDRTGLGGTEAARQALLDGEVDLYWEYTATAWILFLEERELLGSSEDYYQQVRERDRNENNVVWLEPAPLNNTYQIATTQKVIDETGVQTLSDYAQLVAESPEDATLCSGTEFTSRDDGLPGVEDHYGFTLPDIERVDLQRDAVYQAVANEGRCEFGSVFATDGRVAALDLVLLEDDKEFFPAYNAAVTMRRETFEEHDQLGDLFAEISPLLDDPTMQQLNRRADEEGEFPEEVARDFLRENDLVS